MVVCKLSSVDKIYKSPAGDVHALKQASCEIEEGEFVVLAGPSGAGKTTLANILGFLDNISSGTYFFRGEDISHLKEKEYTILRRKNVGFVFQSFNLMNILTAQENVAMASELIGIESEIAKKKALEALDMVGMVKYAKRFPHQLSGGQQQRVSIARALVKQPAIMIADEPTASLDAQNTSDTIKLLIDLNKNFKSVCIVCTHDDRVIRVSPRLIHVDDGRVESQKNNVA